MLSYQRKVTSISILGMFHLFCNILEELGILNMLEVKDLVVKVEEKIILNGVSMSLEKNENYIMFGSNGSGKTTLLNAIMGMQPFEVVSGRIVFMGEDITEKTVEKLMLEQNAC